MLNNINTNNNNNNNNNTNINVNVIKNTNTNNNTKNNINTKTNTSTNINTSTNTNTNTNTNTLTNQHIKYIKKCQLIKQKILTNATITHNSYQYHIQQLNIQLDNIIQSAKQILQQFNNTINQITKQYRNDILAITNTNNNYNYNNDSNAITNSSNKQQFNKLLSCQQLKKYLISQKQLLSNLISSNTTSQLQSQQSQQQSKSKQSKSSLHTILKKHRLQKLLQQIKIQQLQKQIKYLSTHVINNVGLIYIPQDSMNDVQEQELNKKIQILEEELERLVMLEVVCSSSNDNQEERRQKGSKNSMENVIQCLDQQANRLNKVYQMLNIQKIAIQQIQNSIQPSIQYLKNIPISPIPTNQLTLTSTSKTHKNTHHHIPYIIPTSNQQLDIILNNSIKITQQNNRNKYNSNTTNTNGEIISNQTIQLQQLNYNLKMLRNKIKKLQ